MKSFKDYFLLFLKGIAMGSADVVPGVSGGTVAFITGIYDKLIYSIQSVNLQNIQLLLKGRFKEFWSEINGNFLLGLFSGIAVSILTFAKIITVLLERHPILVWSFFFGLIIISALLIARDIQNKNWKAFVAGVAGAVIAYFITELTPAETPEGLWFVFISGAIAICAMILPGISGAFLLLILGKYSYVFNALNTLDIPVIITFVVGCLVGLLSFSRLIAYFLKNHQSLTIAVLSGFMIGSLNKVWPWKMVDSYRMNSKGEQVPFLEHNILPNEYLELTGNDPQLILSIMLAAAGIFVVVLIDRIAHYSSDKKV